MLRMYCLANWFNLADEACEEALYDTPVFRAFCGFDLGHERIPDATTLLHFRHVLATHQLGTALFAKVGTLLMRNGMRLSGGTMVDTTLIAPPFDQESGPGILIPIYTQPKKQGLALWHEAAKQLSGFTKRHYRGFGQECRPGLCPFLLNLIASSLFAMACLAFP